MKELLKERSLEAAQKLIELLNCGNPKVELSAAQEILNRTEGKPLESVQMDVSGAMDLRGHVRAVLLEQMKNDAGRGNNGDA